MEFHCNSKFGKFSINPFSPPCWCWCCCFQWWWCCDCCCWCFNDDDVVIVVVLFLSLFHLQYLFFSPGSSANQISVATQLLNLFCSPLAGFGILEERKSENGFWLVVFFSWVNASPPPPFSSLVVEENLSVRRHTQKTHTHTPHLQQYLCTQTICTKFVHKFV